MMMDSRPLKCLSIFTMDVVATPIDRHFIKHSESFTTRPKELVSLRMCLLMSAIIFFRLVWSWLLIKLYFIFYSHRTSTLSSTFVAMGGDWITTKRSKWITQRMCLLTLTPNFQAQEGESWGSRALEEGTGTQGSQVSDSVVFARTSCLWRFLIKYRSFVCFQGKDLPQETTIGEGANEENHQDAPATQNQTEDGRECSRGSRSRLPARQRRTNESEGSL